MTMDEFNRRIDQSEDDFKNGKYIDGNDLLKSVETWKSDSSLKRIIRSFIV